MSSNRSLIVAIVAVVVAGCTTNTVQLDYAAGNIEAAKYTDVRPIDTVIVFDYRKNDPHWLGAIRGGFGNPLKKLTTEEAVSEVVQDAFESALQARGIPSEGADPFTMRINLIRFDSSQYVRREAHANVTVMLEGSDGESEWTESFQSDVIQGSMVALDTGIFASVEDLRKVALQALNEVIDQALNDPGFIDTLKRTTSAAAGAASASSVAVSKPKQESKQNTTADGKTVAETLAALKLLHDQGVLSDKDYMQKQREIINEHTRKTQASLAGDESLTTASSSPRQEGSPSGATAAATVTATTAETGAVVGVTAADAHEQFESAPLNVAIFPFGTARPSWQNALLTESEVVETLMAYIQGKEHLSVVYSYFDDRSQPTIDAQKLWQGNAVKKMPHISNVVSLGKKLGADVVLMVWHLPKSYGQTTWHYSDIDLYVIAVHSQKSYSQHGIADDAVHLVDASFSTLKEDSDVISAGQ